MIVRPDDTLLLCLVAAALVVLAHAVDAVTSRRTDGDGWGRSVALGLCALGVCVLIPGVVRARSTTDLLLAVSTFAAVVVSALPLVGVRSGDGTPRRPANPWDRAYRVRPARVAQLLSAARTPSTAPRPAAPAPAPAPAARRPEAAQARATAARPVPPAAPPRPADVATPPPRTGSTAVPSSPEVYEAEETLHDVGQVVGDLGRLLGLGETRTPRR